MFHVVGDSAIALVLNALASTGSASIWRGTRVRLEHGDGLTPDQFDRARRLGVIVVQNPTHLDLGGLLAERYDPAFLANFQPLRSLVEAGIALALGGDGIFNPFLNIMAAVTHAHRPAEALTREQAVVAYTRGSAFAEFAEHEKGTLEPGMLADLAVLSHDIFAVPLAVLPATTSVLTVIGGRVVWDELTSGAPGPPARSARVTNDCPRALPWTARSPLALERCRGGARQGWRDRSKKSSHGAKTSGGARTNVQPRNHRTHARPD
jgi:predicted amidohydrolase YtcJ